MYTQHTHTHRHTHLPNWWPHYQDYAVVTIDIGGKGDGGRRNIKAFGLLFINMLLVLNLIPAWKKPKLGYSIHRDG